MFWRPRHTQQINKGTEESDINKKFKEISKIYDEEDSEFLSENDKIKRAARKKVRDAFMVVVNKRRNVWEENKSLRELEYKSYYFKNIILSSLKFSFLKYTFNFPKTNRFLY